MKRLDEIPESDLNEWGYPNKKWRFAGFDGKTQTTMWKKTIRRRN